MQLGHKTTDLDRYIYLINLLDHNETLFYKTVMSDPARFLPIVLRPDHRRSLPQVWPYLSQARGMYLSITRRGKVKEDFEKLAAERCALHLRHRCRPHPRSRRSWRKRCRDPIGKLQPLHRCAGVPPQYLLPCTSTQVLIMSNTCTIPCIWVSRKTRPATADLFSFVDEFVEACRKYSEVAAFTLRIGREQTPCTCSSATATSTASITTTCRVRLGSLLRDDQRGQTQGHKTEG